MFRKTWGVAFLGLGLAWTTSALASNGVLGFVAGSIDATVGGRKLQPSTALFSGDRVEVKEGAAFLRVGTGTRIELGSQTCVLFSREGQHVRVELNEGRVSMLQPGDRPPVELRIGTIRVVGAPGFQTLGEVALAEGLLRVQTWAGLLRVENRNSTIEVPKGRNIILNLRPQQNPSTGTAAGHPPSHDPLRWATVSAGAVSAVTSGVALSRAGDAKAAAEAVQNTASQAVSASQAAQNAAAGAASTATALGQAIVSFTCSVVSPSDLPPNYCTPILGGP